jgi:hypothetical protein
MVGDMRVMRGRPVLRMVRGLGGVVVRGLRRGVVCRSPGILVNGRFLRRTVAVSAAWRGEGRSAEGHACKARDHEFSEVPVVHNAPLYTFFFVVVQEPISRLRQGRRSQFRFLTGEISASSLKVLRFDGYSENWLDFIVRCRAAQAALSASSCPIRLSAEL